MTKIIADACCNHLGDERLITRMIETASEANVDFIKFQAFKADNLTEAWMDRYDYYKSVELKDEHYPMIMDLCAKHNITPMFTVFNESLVDTLITNDVKWVKIASPDADNESLVKICTQVFDNVIISTGMAKPKRINGVNYLYCVSMYPCNDTDIDYEKMVLYDGFSDHTVGLDSSKIALKLGMDYIERHFTLGKYLPGKDHLFSSTPDEFKELVRYRDYIENVKKYKNRWRNF